MVYIGLAFSAQMLSGSGRFAFEQVPIDKINADGLVSCVNPSHKVSLDALKTRYGISIPVSEKATKVSLVNAGDAIIVLQISGLPRETREFTAEEVAQANFSAMKFTVL
jgi:hypothetical protein